MFPQRADRPEDRSKEATFGARATNRFSLEHAFARRIPLRTQIMALDHPMVSISFDDFPASAHAQGAQVLEDHGARGTYFTSTGQLGSATDLWQVANGDAVIDLHGRGHEIGLHTHSHRPVSDLPPAEFEADLAANRAALRRLVPSLTRETFAYPFGIVGIRQKRQLRRLARASRSVQPGINSGRLDIDFIKAYELIEPTMPRERIGALMDEAMRHNGWLVFLTHDVAEHPSPFGTSPALLASVLEEAERRAIPVLPINRALDAIGVP